MLVGACANPQSGTSGNDTLIGTDEGDRLKGFAGDDELTGEGSDDCLKGGSGRDDVAGGAGDDQLNGGKGVDELAASSGNDRIESRDRSADKVRCGKGEDFVKADARDDVSKNCETVRI